MTYTKQTWTDEELADVALYDIKESDDTPINEGVKIELVTDVITAGSGVTAERMGHMEDGIYNAHVDIAALTTKVDDANNLKTTGGTSTAYTITTTGAAALVTGEAFRIKFHATAGATPTLNRDSKGAKSLKYYDSSGTKQACTSAQIIANMIVNVIYDGTDYVLLGGGSGGGLTVSIASVVGSNVTAVEDTQYILDLSGLTANRDFNLPTPSAAGKRIKVTISAGHGTYALLLKANSTELERIFITNETYEFTSTGTGAANWTITQKDKIHCHAILERQTAQSINNATATKVQLATAVANIGNIGDTTNYKVTCRRAGNYRITLFGSVGAQFEDQEFLEVEAYVNGVLKKFYATHTSSATGNRYQSPSLTFDIPLAVGDYVEFYLYHNEGAAQNTDTMYYPQLAVLEI